VPEVSVPAPELGLSQVVRVLTTEGLTTKGQDGRPLPRLAKSWTPRPDGLEWRFTLRDDVWFHDGTKLDAALTRQSLTSSIARPGTKALYPGLVDIVDIRDVGQHELVITLRQRSAFLLDDLEFPITKPAPKPPDGQPERKPLIATPPISTGPFRAQSITDQEIELQAHTRYHHGAPKISRVLIRPYGTLRTAWASMMRQEIDVLWDVAHESSEFVGSNDVAMHSYMRNYVYLIAFNSSRPQLASPAVRRALNAAINRDSLIKEVLKGRGVPANGPMWPQHWAYDRTLPGYTHDPSLASATLDAAGFPLPRTGTGKTPASRLRFVCLVPQNWTVLERLALSVQKQLYDIGVDMQLEAVTADEYVRRIPRSDFDAVIIDMISGPLFTRPYSFWRWGGEQTEYNVFGYRSALADRWFDGLRGAQTEAEYKAAAGQLQRVLLDDPPALFLAWQERTRAINRRFEVPVEPGRDPIPTLWQWGPRDPSASTH
jgi:peptide/nickel transport system substrate-binding protein